MSEQTTTPRKGHQGVNRLTRTCHSRWKKHRTKYTYDNEGELVSAVGKESGGVTNRLMEQMGYGYDAAGNLNYRTNNAMLQTFNVNSVNELTTTTNGRSLTVAGMTTSVATNVTVNSTKAALYADATFAEGGFTIASGNNTYTAIAKDGYGRLATNVVIVNLPVTNSYAYDLNGNLTNDSNRNFAYDDENELIAVWVANTWSNNFVYDGKMRKRIERDYVYNGGSWVETNEVRYIYDGNVVVQERDQNNLPKVTYTRGIDLSGSLQGAGGIGGLLARTDNSKFLIGDQFATAYYHADGNGNVTYLLYNNQTEAAKYLYDPYGNTLGMNGSLAAVNHYRFSSKEWNDNDGLYYYEYRFYDPSLQRWVNKDPIEDGGFDRSVNFNFDNWDDLINLYRFIRDNPTFGVDGQGLTVYVCSRKSGLGRIGNHSYFYNDSGSGCQSCGENASSGTGMSGNAGGCPDSNEPGPNDPTVKCQPIPNSGGSKGQAIMDCCKNTANNGPWIPPFSDCHTHVNHCLKANGYNPPKWNPRLGPPNVGPITSQ